MKKPIILILSILIALSLVSCSGGGENPETFDRPPAFSVLQKQLTLTKHSEKGENASFSKSDFESLIGEDLTYITVTSLPEQNLGTLIFKGATVAKGQTIPAGSLEYLKFVPNAETERAAFGFTCDGKSFVGKELDCDICFTDGANLAPIASDSVMDTVAGIGCEAILDITEPNGDAFTVNVITYPRDGEVTISEDGRVVYTPNPDFSGSDSLVYTVTDRFGKASEHATLKIRVEKNESGIYFADMEGNKNHLYAYKACTSDIMVYRTENGKFLFDPENCVSKIEFLVMMMSAAGLDADIVAVADSAVSDDNALSSGLKGYLSAAAEGGLIKLNNGAFSPYEDITVADAAYMVTAALNLPGIDSESIAAGTQDRTLASILAANKAGFFESMEPSHKLTKQETAEILCRMIDYIKENNM